MVLLGSIIIMLPCGVVGLTVASCTTLSCLSKFRRFDCNLFKCYFTSTCGYIHEKMFCFTLYISFIYDGNIAGFVQMISCQILVSLVCVYLKNCNCNKVKKIQAGQCVLFYCFFVIFEITGKSTWQCHVTFFSIKDRIEPVFYIGVFKP